MPAEMRKNRKIEMRTMKKFTLQLDEIVFELFSSARLSGCIK